MSGLVFGKIQCGSAGHFSAMEPKFFSSGTASKGKVMVFFSSGTKQALAMRECRFLRFKGEGELGWLLYSSLIVANPIKKRQNSQMPSLNHNSLQEESVEMSGP
jgi:hypothetical protein